MGLTAEPNGVDEHPRLAWDPIFNRNDPDEPQTIRNFLRISHFDGPEKEPHSLPLLDGQTLMTIAAHTETKSAQSFDNTKASELKPCPLIASQWIANLFNLIEDGQKWPDSTPTAKAIWLLKPKSDPTDPISFRILIITSAIDRRRAGARVRELQPYTNTWAPDELFSSVPAKGLSDAAYMAAAEAGAARHTDHIPTQGYYEHFPKPMRRQGVHSKHLNIITACTAIGPTLRLEHETNKQMQEGTLPTAAATDKDTQNVRNGRLHRQMSRPRTDAQPRWRQTTWAKYSDAATHYHLRPKGGSNRTTAT